MNMTHVKVLIVHFVHVFLFQLSRGQSEGDLRLTSSWSNAYATGGRLEVYHSGSWGTICDDNFNSSAASVACRQLGYRTQDALGYTTGCTCCSEAKIWMDDLKCGGSESKLRYCSFKEWGDNNCGHSEDVGVKCYKIERNGGWSWWNSWGTCSRSCGNGYQKRIRTCNNPRPSNGGACCSGDAYQIQNCHTKYCQVHGKYGPWSEWGQCDVTCGSGKKRRSRSCSSPAPAHGGSNCLGISTELRTCSLNGCPGQYSGSEVGGVAAGCIAGTFLLILVGYGIYRVIYSKKHGKSQKISNNKNTMKENRGRRNNHRETIKLKSQQNDGKDTVELPCMKTKSGVTTSDTGYISMAVTPHGSTTGGFMFLANDAKDTERYENCKI